MAIQKGNVLQQRFEVLGKLGWGEFSTVWLVHDRHFASPELAFLALKIAKCNPLVTATTKYEARLLQYIRDSGVVTVSDRTDQHAPTSIANICHVFDLSGPYGQHLCFTMPVYGSNLLCVIDQVKDKRSRRAEVFLNMTKDIITGVLRALATLESLNVLHTDLKPENVLCSLPDPNCVATVGEFLRGKESSVSDQFMRCFISHTAGEVDAVTAPVVTLADFGLALLLETEVSPNVKALGGRRDAKITVEMPGVLRNSHGILIQTREYRAPEVLLGLDYNCRTDVWSLGCMAFELITGQFLMDPKKKTRVEKEMDIEHIMMMMQLIGPVPARLFTPRATPNRRMRHQAKYFDEVGVFLYPERLQAYPRRQLATELETFMDQTEAHLAAQFILSCFTFDPFERHHASTLLNHAWLQRRGATSN